MKGSEQFKIDIKGYLDNRAANDELFAPMYAKEGKNIDDCITYILNWVKASGCEGFSDAEIFGQAVHYYQEDGIDVGKPIKCKVVVNHEIVLTEEEIQQARREAVEREIAKQQAKLHEVKKPAAKKLDAVPAQAPSLFD